MLNISHNPDLKPRLIGHGYHTSDRGKKYVRVLKHNRFYFVQVKLLAHKELHVHYPTAAPYKFVGSFLELELDGNNIPPCKIEALIDQRLNGVWFELGGFYTLPLLFEINSKTSIYMERTQIIQALLETMLGMILGATLLCLIYSYLPMTYNKKAIRVASTEYVREVTRWAGHTYGNNIPVYKGLRKLTPHAIKQRCGPCLNINSKTVNI